MSNEATNSAAARLGWLNRAFHTLVGEALHRSIAWFISSNYEFNGISLVEVSLYRLYGIDYYDIQCFFFFSIIISNTSNRSTHAVVGIAPTRV